MSAFLPKTFELEDLIAAGQLGLITAAERYAPRLHGGAPFDAYARRRIHGAIVDSVRRLPYWESKTVLPLAHLPEPAAATEIEEGIDAARRASALTAAVEALDGQQKAVITRHYDGGECLGTIGRSFAVGKSRASQIHLAAVGALRIRLRTLRVA